MFIGINFSWKTFNSYWERTGGLILRMTMPAVPLKRWYVAGSEHVAGREHLLHIDIFVMQVIAGSKFLGPAQLSQNIFVAL